MFQTWNICTQFKSPLFFSTWFWLLVLWYNVRHHDNLKIKRNNRYKVAHSSTQRIWDRNEKRRFTLSWAAKLQFSLNTVSSVKNESDAGTFSSLLKEYFPDFPNVCWNIVFAKCQFKSISTLTILAMKKMC